MNTLEFKLFSNPRMAALVLVTSSAFGLLAACSNDSNSVPSTPIVNTGGGGSGGKGGGVAGDDNSAGDNSAGESNANGGSAQGGGASGGAAGAAGEAGEAGEGGEAGSTAGTGGAPATCPTSDVGFYNQPSNSQTQKFDNAQRLGTYTTLPTLPGG